MPRRSWRRSSSGHAGLGDVTLAPRAAADLEDIWNRIAGQNFQAADDLIRRIVKKLELVAEFPGLSARRPGYGATTLLLVEWPYRIVYGKRDPGGWLA